MNGSGAGGGAYLLQSNVSIRSGKRKHLLFIAKLEQGQVGANSANAVNTRAGAKAFQGMIQFMQVRNKTSW
jgi:hypothetical protein